MSSTDHYDFEYGVLSERGPEPDSPEAFAAQVERDRRARRACRVNDACNIVLLVLGFVGLAGTLSYALVGLLTGTGK